MASSGDSSFVLPKVPVAHSQFISHVNGKDGAQVLKALVPYNEYEAKLREGFAQHRDHESLQDPNVNAVPLFNESSRILRICKRDIDEKTHHNDHIIPLSAKDRKSAGSPATVTSMLDFKKNFNLFSESSLADLDWSNVVAAGSSVVTALLPVPDKYNTSKKALREYYHQQLAPSSDVDLFIWGLDEAAAIEKIKQIEASIRNAILEEVTTVRTKNAITIASHYPIRHVQIVLRLYKSVSEILSGFDVDCSCFAYDGSQVYGTPRGIAAFMTQTNIIDLTRRSPSYESRLSKYAHRGFEVHWPDLDRSRIDPTIFERSFARTMGLARLLVLEQLPKPGDREEYLDQRREERGRPLANTYYRSQRSLPDNVKDNDPDDIPEWVYDDEVSNYHSFTVPYGPKYHAKKIEKLLYTKDILLNAEWNQNKDRTVTLHRHPCFIGPAESVIHDCCGFCPEPQTDEEREVAEEEGKIYVSGEVSFLKDDPGRQAIGSFNPLTDDDWTDMAYIGNTQELCQKICEGDVDFVDKWCKDNPDGLDRRDHTGRTPLQLAAHASTPKVLNCLINHGARIVARLVDGTTALHIAAARGNEDMVTKLLKKSEANEVEEAEKEDRKKAEKRKNSTSSKRDSDDHENDDKSSVCGSDEEIEEISSEEDDTAMTDGSFVKVADKKGSDEDALDDDSDSEPDVYDVNVFAWDTPVSPLHLAIIGGHVEVINALIGTFGADALLPIKVVDEYSRNPKHAIMTLVLAARLVGSNALQVSNQLLSLGASSAQADNQRISAFHYLVAKKKVGLLKACVHNDGAAAKSALNHLVLEDTYWRPNADTPLTTAIKTGNAELVELLLDMGAKPNIGLDDYISAYTAGGREYSYTSRNQDLAKLWREDLVQPISLAVENDMPEIVLKLLEAGADINTIDKDAHQSIATFNIDKKQYLNGKTVLDAVASQIEKLEQAIAQEPELAPPITLQDEDFYLKGSKRGSYAQWFLSRSVETARNIVSDWAECRTKRLEESKGQAGQAQRTEALNALKTRFADLQNHLRNRGAKSLAGLHPNIPRPKEEDEETSQFSKEKSFEPKVTFRLSASDEVLDGYLQLFEAAWDGNSDKIKALTLAHWGPENKMKPLQVSNQDAKGFTPFAIATYRRHFETAKLILGIANAQFKEDDNNNLSRRRYTIANDGEYSDSDDSDSDNLDITYDVVDDIYTYDNVAALQQSIGSTTSGTSTIQPASSMMNESVLTTHVAASMLTQYADVWWFLDKPEKEAMDCIDSPWTGLSSQPTQRLSAQEVFQSCMSQNNRSYISFSRYAILSRDMAVFRFWLQCCQEAMKMKYKHRPDPLPYHPQDLKIALQRGYLEEIAELIKFAGAELPLDVLIKKSGIEEAAKPKYYQGLSIGGKKMTAWAREQGGRGARNATTESIPPLQQAAHAGGLAAVEWFLSDTPLRLYREYREKHKDDERLQKLAEAPGGFERAVGLWLKQRNNLALHGAVLSRAKSEQSLEVVKYLIAIMPESIELVSVRKSLTPLALAFIIGRLDAAGALIEAGADQTTRDSTGKNLVHMALLHASQTTPTDTKKFRAFLELIDKRVIRSLLTERCTDGPGSLTPLALWLAKPSWHPYSWFGHTRRQSNLAPETFNILQEFGGANALTMMDGSGQFPLHIAVKSSHAEMVKLMLEYDPSLLARENAMGQTPLELAHSMYVRECAKGNPDIHHLGYKPLDRRDAKEFAPRDAKGGKDADAVDDGDEDWNNDITRTWAICRVCSEKNPRKRKLVSVIEAREVAKRLADKNKKKREEMEETDGELKAEESGDGGGKKEVKRDEVDGWLDDGALEMG
ncbi:MAG: hypothetical protein Q9182_002305 [Xanthomendoza sp. 2 TL-2023]